MKTGASLLPSPSSILRTTSNRSPPWTQPKTAPPAPPPPTQPSTRYRPSPCKDFSSINDKLRNLLSKASTKLTTVVNKPQEYDPSRPNEYEELKKQEQPPEPIETEEKVEQWTPQSELSAGEEKALKMMEKFNYKFGMGLGKNNQGILTPYIVRKIDNTIGVIEQSQLDFTDLLPTNVVQKRTFEQHKQQPTSVLVLVNMITSAEIDSELEGEIREEMAKYGTISQVYVHNRPDLDEDLQVRVFVRYETTE